MKTATGLTLIALGAVLAFAVNGHPWFLNLQIVGWILMIIGVIGLVIPRRGYGWLRRQMVVRRTPEGRQAVGVREKRYPPYIMINPAAAGVAGSTAEAATAQMPEMPTDSDAESWSQADATVLPDKTVLPDRTVVPDKETVEEFFEE
jgi:membrane-bound ClpP family serine protease